jgi:hypothetical protein
LLNSESSTYRSQMVVIYPAINEEGTTSELQAAI